MPPRLPPAPPSTSPAKRTILRGGLGVALALCLGCQATTTRTGEGPEGASEDREAEGTPDAERNPRRLTDLEAEEPHRTRPLLDPGSYRDDPRFVELASNWHTRTRDALARIPVVTGLAFVEGPAPRVFLGPLGDASLPFVLRTDVVAGRRRVSVHVNAEPMLGGTVDPDALLLRALGSAVLQDVVGRRGEVASWVLELAGMVAAGDLDRRLARMQRDWALGDISAIAVDPTKEEHAESTGAGALLLLRTRVDPADLRRFLRFVADGDEPDYVMGRLTGERGAAWVEPARIGLHATVRALDARPWMLLDEARKTYEEAGRMAMEAGLPARFPIEVRDEFTVLRARAAMDAGDVAIARSHLRALPEDAPRRLQRPAEALALRLEVERAPGGDPAKARRLVDRLRRDFPKSAATQRLERIDPLLGYQDDPIAWLRAARAQVQREGPAFLEGEPAARYARMLLMDHRLGAAERFLVRLGPRGRSPEMHAIARAVADAQEDPSAASLAAAEERMARWVTQPSAEARQAVIDSGMAGAAIAAVVMRDQPHIRGEKRASMAAMGAEAAGDERALRALALAWSEAPARVLDDLPHIAHLVAFDALDATIESGKLGAGAGVTPEELWRRVGHGIPPRWLRNHPRFLALMGSREVERRLRAYDAVLGDETLDTPAPLLRHMLRDPAASVRVRAVARAGERGVVDVIDNALRDAQPTVRTQAVQALAEARGMDAVEPLLARWDGEDDVATRRAMAVALLELAPGKTRVLRALLSHLRAEDPRLRDALALEIGRGPPVDVARASADAMSAELARRRPSRAHMFRLVTIAGRATGLRLDYHPASRRADVRRVIEAVRQWVARASEHAAEAK